MSIVIRNNNDFPKGHVCNCEKEHQWPLYVFAHKHDELIHTCDSCGRKVTVHELGIKEESK